MKLKHEFMCGMLVHLSTNIWYDIGDSGHEAFTQLWVKYMDYLKESGFDQIPGASCNYVDENFSLLTDYSKNVISKKHFLGMLQTT